MLFTTLILVLTPSAVMPFFGKPLTVVLVHLRVAVKSTTLEPPPVVRPVLAADLDPDAVLAAASCLVGRADVQHVVVGQRELSADFEHSVVIAAAVGVRERALDGEAHGS